MSASGHLSPGQAVLPHDGRTTTLRETMSQFATGVTVLTTGGEHCHGMTANAFTSVSLEPPLVLCCVKRTAIMHDAIAASGSFAVSVLGADQTDLARYFSDNNRPRGRPQFDAVKWVPGRRTGAPLLTGALGWVECELAESHQGGDHSIFVGTVLESSRGPAGDALVFFGSGFTRAGPGAR